MAIRTYFSEKFVEMPNAADNNNRVVQYIGDTTDTYRNGYFYKSNGTSWNEIEVQSLAEYAKTSELTTAINNEKTARESGDTSTLNTAKTYTDTKASSVLTEAKKYAETVSEKAMHFKGSVETYAELEKKENPTQGDMWNVEETGANYAWTGSTWDKLSETLDLSIYALKETTINGKKLDSNITLKADDVGVALDVSSQSTTEYSGTIKATLSVSGTSSTSTAGIYTSDYSDFLLKQKASASDFASHISNTSNPHNVTAEQVGAYSKESVNNLITTEANARATGDSTTLSSAKSYSDTQINNLSSSLQTKIDAKADKTDVLWTADGVQVGLSNDNALESPLLCYASDNFGVEICNSHNYIASKLVADGSNFMTEKNTDAKLVALSASVSGDIKSVYDTLDVEIDALSASISKSSSIWNAVYDIVLPSSANWNGAAGSIDASGGLWNEAAALLKGASGSWNATSNTVANESKYWSMCYNTVKDSSATWENYESEITALRGRIEVNKDSIGYYV